MTKTAQEQATLIKQNKKNSCKKIFFQAVDNGAKMLRKMLLCYLRYV